MIKIRTDLHEPRYTTPEVLSVTRLRPEVLQTWVNRDALGPRNTGRGKRRMYSALDVVKLAIMRRMADLQVALATSLDIAHGAATSLEKNGMIEWNLYIFLRPNEATNEPRFEVISSGGPLSKYAPAVGDPAHIRLSEVVENFPVQHARRKKHSLVQVYRNKALAAEQGLLDEQKRDDLARRGFHAEPAIVFPLGEIVNGALLQLEEIDRGEGRTDG